VGALQPALRSRAHRGSVLVPDGLLVLLVTALALGTLVYQTLEGSEVSAAGIRLDVVNVLAVALLLAGALSLTWQRPAAMPVLVLSGTVFVIAGLLGSASPLLALAPLMALYAVAANSALTVSAVAAGALAIGGVLVSIAYPGPLDDDYIDYMFSVVAAWLLGYGVRLNRARTSLLEAQARQLTREQAAKTQEAVEKERTRIARELHDIVAHRVVVIVAQAGAARRVFDAESVQARHVLSSIETLGREALIEMRRLLGVLWTHAEGSTAPQPGLDELPALVASMERAGLPVLLTIEGEPRPLPAGVELNAYRIVQEALTNTLKHAGPTQAQVMLAYHPEFIELRVSDEGRGHVAGKLAPGHGLVGMRQRAAMLGGELSVGPRPGGGFEVTAKLPVGGEQL
jgi:signal transduction histidine kinase